jgi:hypothetical protein
MDFISYFFLNNNNTITEEDQKNILSNNSFDEDTIPDEDFNETNNIKRTKLKSCPNVENKGPNINLKINYKRYSNQKEKELFFEKIKKKKKTELCKNYEFYHDCYYGENCCFAHGVDELRDNILSPNYKTKMCKSFIDNKYCSFGIRCSYLHKIK